MAVRRSTLLTLLTAAWVALLLLTGGSVAVAAPTVPTVPTSVTAAVDNAALTATIKWAPPVNTGGSPITGYTVARNGSDSSGTGPWTATVSASTRSYTFSKLLSRSTYTLTVRAVTKNGAGAIVTKTVTIVATLPGVPTGTPDAVQLQSDSSAAITWAPPASTGGKPITGYIVGHNGLDRTGVANWSTTVSATARGFTFTKLGPNYDTATVRAVTAAGIGPAASIMVYSGGPLIFMQPGGDLTVSTNRSAGTATVNWILIYYGNHNEPADAFRIGRDGTDTSGSGPWSTSLPSAARSFTFSKLRPGVTYTFSLTSSVLWDTKTYTETISITF
ncbi:MAG: fibronectin type III domain-containing protein [Nakamurella sp.]